MAAPNAEERRTDLKTQLNDWFHDPLKLRVTVIGIVIAAAFFGVYAPLAEKIAKTTKMLKNERKLGELATQIEQMQKQCDSFKNRLPQQVDTKEWMQYVLDGVRGLPLKLTKLDCTPAAKIGPYQAVTLQIVVEGSYYDLDQFLRWLETDQRLFRTDQISINLLRSKKKTSSDVETNKDDMVMLLTVVGMAG